VRLSKPTLRKIRLVAIATVSLLCFTGAPCGSSSPTPRPQGRQNRSFGAILEGPDPNTNPGAPATLQSQLETLIAQRRSGQGLGTAFDNIARGVATQHNNFQIATSTLTPIRNGVDFPQQLINAGAQLNNTGVVGYYLARGFSSAATLFAQMVAQPGVLDSPDLVRVGVIFGAPGAGNYWTIIFY
jgi:hypothetical protein